MLLKQIHLVNSEGLVVNQKEMDEQVAAKDSKTKSSHKQRLSNTKYGRKEEAKSFQEESTNDKRMRKRNDVQELRYDRQQAKRTCRF